MGHVFVVLRGELSPKQTRNKGIFWGWIVSGPIPGSCLGRTGCGVS